jgi:hypothetical protein
MISSAPTIQSARRAIAISFGVIGLLGGLFIFLHGSRGSIPMAVGRSVLFILIMAGFHDVSFHLWKRQQAKALANQTEADVRLQQDSAKSLRSAIKDGLIIQLILILLTSMVLDGGLVHWLCLCAIVGYWIGVGLVLLRRHSSPAWSDLFYFRWGPLGLTLFSHPLAQLVIIIGQSTEIGLSRLLHG